MGIYYFLLITSLLFFVFLRINRTKIIGSWGEKKVSFILSMLSKEYRVYNDVLIVNGNGRTTQIDHLILSPYGIFVIETKNYKGWIYGSEYADTWTQNIYGDKYSLPNPIRQNWGHVKALQEIFPQYAIDKFISIVVFSSHATLKTSLSNDSNVVYTWHLLSNIKQYRSVVLSDGQIRELYVALMQKMTIDKTIKKKHIMDIKMKQREHDSLVESGICPRCGGKLVLRKGRYGKFYGCSNYPQCRFTKQL